MYAGNGFFARKPPPSPIAPTTSSLHHPPEPSPRLLVSPTSAAAPTTDLSSSDPRRHNASAPLAPAFGLLRRDPGQASTLSTATNARRSLTVEEQQSPARKISEPGVVRKTFPLSPKRKPFPKGSTSNKLSSEQSPKLNGKLGKMDLTNGSTMVYRSHTTSH